MGSLGAFEGTCFALARVGRVRPPLFVARLATDAVSHVAERRELILKAREKEAVDMTRPDARFSAGVAAAREGLQHCLQERHLPLVVRGCKGPSSVRLEQQRRDSETASSIAAPAFPPIGARYIDSRLRQFSVW